MNKTRTWVVESLWKVLCFVKLRLFHGGAKHWVPLIVLQLLVLLGRGVVLLVAHSGFCNARFGVLCGMFGCCAWWFGLVSEGAKKSFLVCVANAVCDTTILRCQQQGRKTATPTLLLLLASFLALCSSSPGWLAGWLAW